MKFFNPVNLMSALILLAFTAPSAMAKKGAESKHPEVYAAEEPETGRAVGPLRIINVTPSAQTTIPKLRLTAPRASRVALNASPKQAPIQHSRQIKSQVKTPPEFDTVRGEQLDSILNRIQLVERILRLSGRAYDYRSMTTAKLESVLASYEPTVSPNNQREDVQEVTEASPDPIWKEPVPSSTE